MSRKKRLNTEHGFGFVWKSCPKFLNPLRYHNFPYISIYQMAIFYGPISDHVTILSPTVLLQALLDLEVHHLADPISDSTNLDYWYVLSPKYQKEKPWAHNEGRNPSMVHRVRALYVFIAFCSCSKLHPRKLALPQAKKEHQQKI